MVGTGFKSNMVPNMGTVSKVSAAQATITVDLTTAGTYCFTFTLPDGTVSNSVCIVVTASTAPIPPPATTITTVTPANAQVTIVWTPTANTEEYIIERGTTPGSLTPVVTTSPVSLTTYTDSDVTNGTTYYYTVTPTGPGGSAPTSTEVEATPAPVPPTPTILAPASLTASYSAAQIGLSWSASVGATSYHVKRSTVSGSEIVLATGIVPTSYSDTAIVQGITYYYTVSAMNGAVESANSNEAFALYPVPVVVLPAVPTAFSATVLSDSAIDLSWTDSSADFTGFVVEQCSGSGCTSFLPIATLGVASRSYSVAGLTDSTVYRFRLKAVNASGSSAYTSVISATTLAIIPPVTGALFYVSNSGSDSEIGSITRPWKTIRYAVSQLIAGNTLYIRSGTYTGATNTIDNQLGTVPAGTDFSTGAITIAAYPSETVTIKPPAGQSAIRISSGTISGAVAQKYLIFQDLILDGANQTSDERHGGPNGVYIDGGANHIRLQRLEVHHWLANGIEASSHDDVNPWSTYHEILNCLVHHNGLGLGTTEAPISTNTGYGLYLQTSDNTCTGNEVYNNGGYGFHLYGNSVVGQYPVSRNIVAANKIHNNGVNGGTNYGIVVAWGDANQVYNNLIYSNIGGILVYTYSTATIIYNNTVYANSPLEGIALQYYSSAPLVKNNIVFANGSGIVDYGGTGSPVLLTNLTTDPSFVSASTGDFHVNSSSSAVNTGTTLGSVTTDYDGVARPVGAAYDIGAFERDGTSGTGILRYVSPTGSDSNSGTITSPWLTISYGISQLQAGYTLFIRAGTYTGSTNTISSQLYTVPSGTSFTNAVTISAYPGETVTIKPPSGVSAIQLYNHATPYLIIQDLTLDMSNSVAPTDADGVIIGGSPAPHHIRIQRCDVKNGPNFGIHTGILTHHLELLNNTIHGFGTVASYPGYDGHAMYLSGSDGLYEGNTIYNCSGYGIHIWSGPAFSPLHDDPCRNIVRNNRVYSNGFEGGATTYGIVVAWGDGNSVYNNLVYNNQGGIQIYTGTTNTAVYNNTVYNNPTYACIVQYTSGTTSIYNNIFYANGTNTVFDAGQSGGTILQGNNITSNPSFTSASTGDFTLLTGSTAIDAGRTLAAVTTDFVGAARPQGTAYDIGAYESSGTAPVNAYYVSNSGSDINNNGSISSPWKTISYGVSRMSAGKTLYIRAGTYTGSDNLIDSQLHSVPGGASASNRVTISAYPAEIVTIRPPDTLGAVRITSSNQSYMTIQDLIIDGSLSTYDAINTLVYMSGGASYNIFQRLELKNSYNFGFQTSTNNGNAAFNQFLNCTVHDNGDPLGPNTNGHGFYIGSSDCLVEGCTVYNNKGMGIQANGASGATSRTVIRNNRCYNNGARAATTGSNIVIMNGTDILVYNNLSYQTDARTNLVGIQVYTGTFAAKVYNNTVYGMAAYDGFFLQFYSSAPLIKNNIAFGCSSNYHDYTGTGAPVLVTNTFAADPLFVDAPNADFTLQAGSPSRNAGTTLSEVLTDFAGTARPQGANYDIGAYERA